MQKLLLIVNPKSGRRRGRLQGEHAISLLNANNIKTDVRLTEYPGHATKLARSLDLTHYDGLCIVGGDGTIHEVVNGLMNRLQPVAIPLGLIAAGTSNSLHQQFGFQNSRDSIDRILTGKIQPLDLLRIKFEGNVSYCVHIVGWASVSGIASRAEKMRCLGSTRYSLAAIAEILIATPLQATITIDNEKIQDEFLLVIGCNTVNIGSGMKMAPSASIHDGQVDLVLVRCISRFQMLNLFRLVRSGAHVNLPYVEYHKAKRFKLESDHFSGINLDGDVPFEKTTGFEVEVIPNAIDVFA